MTLDERIKRFKRSFPCPTEWDSERGSMIRMIYDLIEDREILLGELKILMENQNGWNDALRIQPDEPGLYLCVRIYPSLHVDIVRYMEHGGFVNHVVAWKPLPDIPDSVKQWMQDMVTEKKEV